MYEKTILFDESTKTDAFNSTSDNKDSEKEINEEKITVEIDYNKIQEAYYFALKQIEIEKANKEALENATKTADDTSVRFASSTDAHFYTVQPSSAITSSDAQAVAYLLDTRNILLIFLLGYFVINAYTKLKNTLTKYYGGND